MLSTVFFSASIEHRKPLNFFKRIKMEAYQTETLMIVFYCLIKLDYMLFVIFK